MSDKMPRRKSEELERPIFGREGFRETGTNQCRLQQVSLTRSCACSQRTDQQHPLSDFDFPQKRERVQYRANFVLEIKSW